MHQLRKKLIAIKCKKQDALKKNQTRRISVAEAASTSSISMDTLTPARTDVTNVERSLFENEHLSSGSKLSKHQQTVNLAAGSKNITEPMMIADINEEIGSNFIVCGKVIHHSDIVSFTNSAGDGAYFKFIIQDNNGKILCTAFYESAQDASNIIQMNKCYQIDGGTMKLANADFNKTNHVFEITIERWTVITEMESINIDLGPPEPFNNISDVMSLPLNSTVNLRGYISHVYDGKTVNSPRKNTSFSKKVIVVKDNQNNQVDIDLWRNDVSKVTEKHLNKLLIIRQGQVCEFKVLQGVD